MQIGLLAKKTGVSVDSIRFYERRGLLARPPRSSGGFRLYTEEDIAALAFLRQVQALGFSLEEIHEFLLLRASRLPACLPVRDRLRRKLFQVRGKIGELKKLEKELGATLRKCNRELRKPHARCPVLKGLRAGQGLRTR
jgi:DNA-binding transcriptional MerR regulator